MYDLIPYDDKKTILDNKDGLNVYIQNSTDGCETWTQEELLDLSQSLIQALTDLLPGANIRTELKIYFF